MTLTIKLLKHKNANSDYKDINKSSNQNSNNSSNQVIKDKRTCGTSHSIKL